MSRVVLAGETMARGIWILHILTEMQSHWSFLSVEGSEVASSILY